TAREHGHEIAARVQIDRPQIVERSVKQRAAVADDPQRRLDDDVAQPRVDAALHRVPAARVRHHDGVVAAIARSVAAWPEPTGFQPRWSSRYVMPASPTAHADVCENATRSWRSSSMPEAYGWMSPPARMNTAPRDPTISAPSPSGATPKRSSIVTSVARIWRAASSMRSSAPTRPTAYARVGAHATDVSDRSVSSTWDHADPS